MKKIFCLFAFLFCLNSFTASLSADYVNWETNFQQALNAAQKSRKPILMLFTSESGCPACNLLKDKILNAPEFVQPLQNRFIFFKAQFANLQLQTVQQSPYFPLYTEYNVNAFPTFIIINSEGRALYRTTYTARPPSAYAEEFLKSINQANTSFANANF